MSVLLRTYQVEYDQEGEEDEAHDPQRPLKPTRSWYVRMIRPCERPNSRLVLDQILQDDREDGAANTRSNSHTPEGKTELLVEPMRDGTDCSGKYSATRKLFTSKVSQLADPEEL